MKYRVLLADADGTLFDFHKGEAIAIAETFRHFGIPDTQEIIAQLGKNPLVRGITLSGGEPMMQAQALCEIAQAAREKGLGVWCYTGFTLEALLGENRADRMALLALVDVLVDGPFVAAQRSLDLLYCGSRNQRLIRVKETLETGRICLFEPDAW